MQVNYRHALLHNVRHKVAANEEPYDDIYHLALCGRLICQADYEDFQAIANVGFTVCEDCERKAN